MSVCFTYRLIKQRQFYRKRTNSRDVPCVGINEKIIPPQQMIPQTTNHPTARFLLPLNRKAQFECEIDWHCWTNRLQFSSFFLRPKHESHYIKTVVKELGYNSVWSLYAGRPFIYPMDSEEKDRTEE